LRYNTALPRSYSQGLFASPTAVLSHQFVDRNQLPAHFEKDLAIAALARAVAYGGGAWASIRCAQPRIAGADHAPGPDVPAPMV